MSIEPLSSSRDLLGESPQWLAAEDVLQRVDILGRTIHRIETRTGRSSARSLPDDVGFALPASDGGIIAGTGRTIVRLDDWTGPARVIAEVEPGHVANRFNDAKVDPAGRVWAGTMSTTREPGTAALYRVERDSHAEVAIHGVTLSNGLDWNPDATLMYHIDSTTQRVDAIAFDVDRGRLGSRRPFVHIAAEDGLPDGLTVDAEGGVWVALFGGGRLRRYTPAGALDAELVLPVSCPTSMAFGGADLRTLFVTSARHRLTPEQHALEPLAGSVLVLAPGVGGREAPRASA